MIVRLLLLFCCVFLFGACASKKKDPYYTRSSGRDYYSANKASVSFLFETFTLEGNRRREGRARMWAKGEKRAESTAVRKASRAFLWDALKAGEVDAWKQTWTVQLPEMLKGPNDFAASVRFGFLDSGE